MTWTPHRLVFRLRAPLSPGQDRPYVAGTVFRGALVARLTRDAAGAAAGADYDAMGRQVDRRLAFSYLYPALDPDRPLFPHYDGAWQPVYGPDALPAPKFDYLLRGSHTAAARDHSRHEVPCLAPHARDGRRVYLAGTLFVQAGCPLRWRQALERLQLGGERSIGWGRVSLEALAPDDAGPLFAGCTLDLTGRRPLVAVPPGHPARAHVLAAVLDRDRQTHRPAQAAFLGPVEPLVRREWGHGAVCDGVYWAPGARATAGETLVIGRYGVWESGDKSQTPNSKPQSPTGVGESDE